ncbi:MAG: hypothetical protein WC928_03610 [Patescibacteria group bacterium]|jgi:hypothetical protein
MNKANAYFFTGVDMTERVLASFSFDSFMLYMPLILDESRGVSDMEDRETDRRGYLTLLDGLSGKIIFTVPFGEIPDEKREKYFEFSQEKAKRLFENFSKKGHTTSFQSRDEEKQQYGGAIYINYHSGAIILSFSGMPELIDEAIMIVLADKLLTDIKTFPNTKIEAVTRNPYWEAIRRKFSKQLEKNLKFISSRRPAGGEDQVKGNSKEEQSKPSEESITLVVDYSRTLQEMINAGNYGWSNKEITAKNFPISPEMTGKKVEVSAKLFHFNRDSNNETSIFEMDKDGYRPATLAELLVLGETQPDLQSQFPIIALGSILHDVDGGRSVPCLRVVNYKREVDLCLCLGWGGYYRFLAVHK